MSHHDMIKLKLQMGISPDVDIEPNMLLAMWQQLQIESTRKRCTRSVSTPPQSLLTTTPMVV